MPGNVAGDSHLHRTRRQQDHREQAEERCERAVVLDPEEAAGREQERVVQDDADERRDGHDRAAPRTARRWLRKLLCRRALQSADRGLHRVICVSAHAH